MVAPGTAALKTRNDSVKAELRQQKIPERDPATVIAMHLAHGSTMVQRTQQY